MGCHCGEPEPYCTHKKEEAPKPREYKDGKIPVFLSQPNDLYSTPDPGQGKDSTMGPWAFGRVMWSPMSGLTGVRPVVDRYSITRYSQKDWRKKNQEILDLCLNNDQKCSTLKENVKCTLDSIVAGADKHQSQNTAKLEERFKLVRDCKEEMEQLIKELRDEIVLLTEAKIKLRYALPALNMPESIAGECIDRRSTRLEQDLVNDEAEYELVKELSMIRHARDNYKMIIEEIEKQILKNRACKDQMELTWSDKKETLDLEAINISLRNNSPTISFFGGAVRLPDSQSSPESWAVYNATLINVINEELNKSRELRKTTEDKLLTKTVQELREQADNVYKALQQRIDETEQCTHMYETELQNILVQIAEAESHYKNLMKLQRQLQCNTKVLQTRLNNRLERPRVENCRDEAMYGLLEEAKFLNTSQSDLQKQIDEINQTVSDLYTARCNMEYAITTKRKSLYVDKERCLAYREKYPDTTKLSSGIS